MTTWVAEPWVNFLDQPTTGLTHAAAGRCGRCGRSSGTSSPAGTVFSHVLLRFTDLDALDRAADAVDASGRDDEALTLTVPSDGGVGSLRTLRDRLDSECRLRPPRHPAAQHCDRGHRDGDSDVRIGILDDSWTVGGSTGRTGTHGRTDGRPAITTNPVAWST